MAIIRITGHRGRLNSALRQFSSMRDFDGILIEVATNGIGVIGLTKTPEPPPSLIYDQLRVAIYGTSETDLGGLEEDLREHLRGSRARLFIGLPSGRLQFSPIEGAELFGWKQPTAIYTRVHVLLGVVWTMWFAKFETEEQEDE